MATTAASKRRNILHTVTDIFFGIEGTALPEIDATLSADGVLPFTALGTDEVQTIDLGGATGGTFQLTYHDARGVAFKTAAIAFDATDAAIETALNLLEPLSPDGVTVTPTAIVTFDGVTSQTEARPQNRLILDETALVGATTPGTGTTTEGVANWVRSGHTEDGAEFEYTGTYEDKRVDASNGPVITVLLMEDAKVRFELAERDLITYENAISASQLSVQTASSGFVGQLLLELGDVTPVPISLALQGLSPEGFPRLWLFHSCLITGTLTDRYNKSANNIQVEITVLADLSKPAGKRMVQVFDMTAPKTT